MQVRDGAARYFAEAHAQDVPPGYKRTEVGVIPEDWEVKQLGEVAEIKNGATPSTQVASYWNGAIPWCTPTDITGTPGKHLQKTERRITDEGLASCAATLLPPGSLLLCSRATIGEVKIATTQICTNQGFKSLVCKPGTSNEFLYYLLLTLKPQMLERAIGSTFLEIGKQDVSAISTSIPDENEQRAIAEALSDVDELLGALEALIAKKRAIKQAAMQQLLTGNTRLPGFSGPWETKRLGEIAEIKNGATPSTQVAAYWDGAIPWCTPTDITSTAGKYLKNTQRQITEAGLASCAASLLPTGSLLLCSRATIGEVKIAQTAICTNQGFKSLVCKEGMSNEFLYYLLLSLKPQMLERAIGSTFLEIGKRDISSISTSLPNEAEQTAIATVLSDMDAEIAALERRRDKTRAIKQGMMQQLLTGRVRLVKPEAPSKQSEAGSETTKAHSWAFNEAVVIATLAKHFGREAFPLGRKRYTKLSYLFHRHAERQVDGYLKKAAGPYNPKTKYGGPERIALESSYIREHKNGPYTGFVAADSVDQAEDYFRKWYGPEAIQWLEQFRFKKNDELELLATVDMAVEELQASGRNVDVAAVKDAIRSHPEWEAKLDRATFSDAGIERAISQTRELFGNGGQS